MGLALAGGLVLLLPACHRVPVSFTDAMFTAASAGYVTGLSTVTTATTWTPLGKLVISLLVQVGGAGITLVTTGLYLLMGRKISLMERRVIAEDKNFQVSGIIRLARNILFFSFTIEGMAALFFTLYFHWAYGYPWLRAAGVSAFHAVSSFNNAGFDLWGDSLEGFEHDPLVLLLTSVLIILGGLGFVVLAELWAYRKVRMLSLHTKIALRTSAWLLIAGTVLVWLFERNFSMQSLSLPDQILNAWFTSVTTRTAGFDSVAPARMQEVTWLVLMILMFIGASPGSTGGGIKTTTFYMLIKTALATIRGQSEVVTEERSIPVDIAHRALVIFLLSMAVVIACTLVDSALEPSIGLLRILFEEVSAFGTVGLTTGITPSVGVPMKWVLIFTMYVGRVGIFTFLISIMQRSQSKVRRVHERILIG